MNELQPIRTEHLFAPLDKHLIELLEGLEPDDWGRSALPKWSVKDIAAHLLDSNLRRLSIARDGFWGEPFHGSSTDELHAFLNKLNHDWVQASKRLSPTVLIALLRESGKELASYFESLDPFAPAVFAVSWAGEDHSVNWFDVAREYTEKWHHQQQIRDVVGKPGIMTREFYAPVIDTFMRVLPFTYRNTTAEPCLQIQIRVTGECGGTWFLRRDEGCWRLQAGRADAACEIVIPGELSWKLFTKGLGKEEAVRAIEVRGDSKLAEPLFTATAIVG